MDEMNFIPPPGSLYPHEDEPYNTVFVTNVQSSLENAADVTAAQREHDGQLAMAAAMDLVVPNLIASGHGRGRGRRGRGGGR